VKSLDCNIFIDQDQIINGIDLYNHLKKHIKYGTDLYVEFDLSTFGMLHPDIKTRDQLASTIFEILCKVSGPDATIIIPSFTFSWVGQSEKVYDLESVTHLGLIPNWLLKQERTVRNLDPMYSVLINGKRSEWYSEYCNSSFGACSVFKKLHQRNAKLIGFGLKQYDPTFIHYIEQYFDENIRTIGYRYLKNFTGNVINSSVQFKVENHKSFVRNLELKANTDYSNLIKDLQRNKQLFCKKFLNSKIFISDCESVFNTSISGLKKDLGYFRGKDGK
jgi:aminoglycoside 3-N-acetyltransferase